MPPCGIRWMHRLRYRVTTIVSSPDCHVQPLSSSVLPDRNEGLYYCAGWWTSSGASFLVTATGILTVKAEEIGHSMILIIAFCNVTVWLHISSTGTVKNATPGRLCPDFRQPSWIRHLPATPLGSRKSAGLLSERLGKNRIAVVLFKADAVCTVCKILILAVDVLSLSITWFPV